MVNSNAESPEKLGNGEWLSKVIAALQYVERQLSTVKFFSSSSTLL
jgi:hypothetical protein